MPDDLAHRAAQGDDGIGIAVVARAMGAPVVRRRAAVGMNSRSRALSTDIGTQLLPPPTFSGVGNDRWPRRAGQVEGQRSSPVRASKPRIAPLTESRWNLFEVDATAITPLMAVGGDRSWVPITPSASTIALM